MESESHTESIFIKEHDLEIYDSDNYELANDDPLDPNSCANDVSVAFEKCFNAEAAASPQSMPDSAKHSIRRSVPGPSRRCPTCKEKCTGYESVYEHLKHDCKLERRLFCEHCKFRTKIQDNMIKHLRSNCRSFRHRCSKCESVLDSSHEFQLHRRVCRKETRYFCPQCSFCTKHESYLERHVERAHGQPGVHACARCGKAFQYAYALRKHRRLCSARGAAPPIRPGELAIRCPGCGATEDYKRCFPGEKRAESCGRCAAKLVYLCAKCGKQYKTVRPCRAHVRFLCQKEPRYYCAHCEFKSHMKANMETHLKAKHSGNAKEHKCPKCNRFYKFRTHMLHHYKYCGHPAEFECKLCDYKTTRPCYLERHLLTHERKKKKLEELIEKKDQSDEIPN